MLEAADHVPGRDSARTARDKSKERIAQIIAKAVSERLRAKPAWAATAEVILHITERMLGICPSAEMGPSIDRKTDAHRQRSVKCGTYSTPDFIADGMSRDLLQALESNRHARIDVADLSLEAGHFALSLLSQLPSRSVRFFGIDRDAAALQLAERILTFALDRSGCGLFKFHTARLDSICDRLPERWPRRFDAVIGNPPWKTRHPTDSPLLRRLLHPFLSGNFDLSLAFILRAHELLKPHGLLSMVLPSGFLFNQNAEMVRSLLLDEYDILKLSIYPRRSFIEIPCLAPVSFLARKHPSARLRRSHTAICYIHDKIGHSKRKRASRMAAIAAIWTRLPGKVFHPLANGKVQFLADIETGSSLSGWGDLACGAMLRKRNAVGSRAILWGSTQDTFVLFMRARGTRCGIAVGRSYSPESLRFNFKIAKRSFSRTSAA